MWDHTWTKCKISLSIRLCAHWRQLYLLLHKTCKIAGTIAKSCDPSRCNSFSVACLWIFVTCRESVSGCKWNIICHPVTTVCCEFKGKVQISFLTLVLVTFYLNIEISTNCDHGDINNRIQKPRDHLLLCLNCCFTVAAEMPPILPEMSALAKASTKIFEAIWYHVF